jgi:hypothetical protein
VWIIRSVVDGSLAGRRGDRDSRNSSRPSGRVVAAFMSCFVAKAGVTARTRRGGFIANWACNCATRRRSVGSRPSCGTTAGRRRDRTRPGRWTLSTINGPHGLRYPADQGDVRPRPGNFSGNKMPYNFFHGDSLAFESSPPALYADHAVLTVPLVTPQQQLEI